MTEENLKEGPVDSKPKVSEMLQDDFFMKSLDIFLLLNKNNDGFVQYDEIMRLQDVVLKLPQKEDWGKADTKKKFIQIFEEFNVYNMDAFKFKEFV